MFIECHRLLDSHVIIMNNRSIKPFVHTSIPKHIDYGINKWGLRCLPNGDTSIPKIKWGFQYHTSFRKIVLPHLFLSNYLSESFWGGNIFGTECLHHKLSIYPEHPEQ